MARNFNHDMIEPWRERNPCGRASVVRIGLESMR